MTENRSLTDKFMLRLPDGMRDRIKAAAEKNGRSMNAEIVQTLEEKYPIRIPPEDEKLVEWMVNNIPSDELEAFISNYIESLGISDKDIEDGLIPGVSIRKDMKKNAD